MHILDSARKREKERRRVHALFGDIDRLRSFQRFAATSQSKSITATYSEVDSMFEINSFS